MTATSKTCVAWHNRASDLAMWAMARLVNRHDAWGAYRPFEEIGREFSRPDGSKATLGSQLTVKGLLTDALLLRHFRARDRSEIIGLHTAGRDNLSLGGGLDIDYHGEGSTAPTVNLAAALVWHDELVRRGFRPLLSESNGAGGYHLRVLLAEAVPADRLFYFLQGLTQDYARLGFPKPPEQFPKQPDVRRCKKGLGNWLRLPGRHHKRDFWSRVWDGSEWLEGHAAIDFLLALVGDSPSLIPDAPVPPEPLAPPPPKPPPAALPHIPFLLRPWILGGSGKGASLSRRIAGYVRTVPHFCEGEGRNKAAFPFACWLVRDMELSDEVATQWLRRWDSGNTPPLGEDELRGILANAHAYGQAPYGCGLDREAPRRPKKHPVQHLDFTVFVEV